MSDLEMNPKHDLHRESGSSGSKNVWILQHRIPRYLHPVSTCTQSSMTTRYLPLRVYARLPPRPIASRAFHAQPPLYDTASPLETRLRQSLKDAMKSKNRPASTCLKVRLHRLLPPSFISSLVRRCGSLMRAGDIGRLDLRLEIHSQPIRPPRIRGHPNPPERDHQPRMSNFHWLTG